MKEKIFLIVSVAMIYFSASAFAGSSWTPTWTDVLNTGPTATVSFETTASGVVGGTLTATGTILSHDDVKADSDLLASGTAVVSGNITSESGDIYASGAFLFSADIGAGATTCVFDQVGNLDCGADITAATLHGDGSAITGVTASNADTVDNIHASSTAVANYLYPLGVGAKFPNTALNTGAGNGLDSDTVDTMHAAEFVAVAGDTMTGPLIASGTNNAVPTVTVINTGSYSALAATINNAANLNNVLTLSTNGDGAVIEAGSSKVSSTANVLLSSNTGPGTNYAANHTNAAGFYASWTDGVNPKFAVDSAGNVFSSGSVTASTYYGDGSSLTGITSATPTIQAVIEAGSTYSGSDEIKITSSAERGIWFDSTAAQQGIRFTHTSTNPTVTASSSVYMESNLQNSSDAVLQIMSNGSGASNQTAARGIFVRVSGTGGSAGRFENTSTDTNAPVIQLLSYGKNTASGGAYAHVEGLGNAFWSYVNNSSNNKDSFYSNIVDGNGALYGGWNQDTGDLISLDVGATAGVRVEVFSVENDGTLRASGGIYIKQSSNGIDSDGIATFASATIAAQLTANEFFGDGSNLTNVSGVWDRTGTTLSPATASDSVQIDGTLTIGSLTDQDGYDVTFGSNYAGNAKFFWDESLASFTSGARNSNAAIYTGSVGAFNTIGSGSHYSFTAGYNNNLGNNHQYSIVLGRDNIDGNGGSHLIGQYNQSSGSTVSSYAFGAYLNPGTGGADNTMVIGRGVSAVSMLNNTITNTIVMGMNSDEATLFVDVSAGAGTTGQVGIGTETTTNDAALIVGDSSSSFGGISLAFSDAPDEVVDSNSAIIWIDDGSSSDATGDLMIMINVGGATKTATIVNYSDLP